MRRTLAVALHLGGLIALFPAPVAAGDARRAMDEGERLFASGSYQAAAARFEQAAADAAAEGLDPAVAGYNRATALLKAGKAAEAVPIFLEAARSGSPALREKAHFNRGNALVEEAAGREKAGDAKSAVGLLDQALDDYERAMAIDPGDEDPKVNHELASRLKARLEQQLKKPGAGAAAGSRTGGTPPPQGDQGSPGGQLSPAEAISMLEAVRQQEISGRTRIAPARGQTAPVDRNW